MSREIVKAKLDVVFKKLFTSDNDVLKSFIGDILDIPTGEIKKIEVLNPNILPAAIDGKQSQLDLNMLVDDKTVNVEIQLRNKGDYKDRAVYYWSKLYSDQLKRGELYKELKRTITINILDFDLFTDSDSPYSSFSLLENNRRELLTNKCSINFFELVKVDA
ncbi:MAG: Rpn family recombination-promoting nuclease/putative transposase, partial [Ruminococcaceae bacterium]|nr:Rpn family recombination-promoting nuclease/putative transposase [Oscillospiraceae bacterium]